MVNRFRSSVTAGASTLAAAGLVLGGAGGAAAGTTSSDDAQAVVAETAAQTTDALAAPESVRVAHAEPGRLDIRWDEVSGAQGYVLLRAGSVDGEYTEIARTGAREVFATDDDVDTTQVHYYRARAIGADGLSAPSAAAVGRLAGESVPEPTFPDSGSLTLDLGPGRAAEGAVALRPGSPYTAQSRVGFVDLEEVTPRHRGQDPLSGDLLTVGDTELVADLPAGDYTVSVVVGDPEAATDLAITAEQMQKVEPTQLAAGETRELTFDLALVDEQLNLEFSGEAANVSSLTITAQEDREAAETPTAYITGDSTVQTYADAYAPQAGWGQMLGRYLDDGVVVANHAIGGRSSKNFISQGRLDTVLREIRPGDTLYVQFGHNDNTYGVDDRYAAPADYRNYLRTYVEGARQRGATPILVTPVSRRDFDPATGEFNVSFPEYVEQATALAEETGTPLVDLSASSREYLDEIGPEEAKSVFLWVPAGIYPNRPDGTQDDTHFQEYGAIQMARLVAEDTAALDVSLAEHVVDVEPPVEAPAVPSDLRAESVTASGLTLHWSSGDGAEVHRVQVKPSSAGEDAWSLATTTTEELAEVGGLEQDASYDLRVIAVNGRGESTPSQALSITTRAPMHSFDVQLSGSPTMDGFTAVDETTAYTAERGYGFLAGEPDGRDRGADFESGPSDLARDFLLPSAETPFAVDVPDGTYAVRVVWGDMIGTARLDVAVEGEDFGAANAGRGTTSSRVLQPVEVEDGQLTVEASGWLNGVEITRLD